MAKDEPVAPKSPAVRPTPAEVAALMHKAIAAARAEGIAVPPDLARKTFAVTRELAALARERGEGSVAPLSPSRSKPGIARRAHPRQRPGSAAIPGTDNDRV